MMRHCVILLIIHQHSPEVTYLVNGDAGHALRGQQPLGGQLRYNSWHREAARQLWGALHQALEARLRQQNLDESENCFYSGATAGTEPAR